MARPVSWYAVRHEMVALCYFSLVCWSLQSAVLHFSRGSEYESVGTQFEDHCKRFLGACSRSICARAQEGHHVPSSGHVHGRRQWLPARLIGCSAAFVGSEPFNLSEVWLRFGFALDMPSRIEHAAAV